MKQAFLDQSISFILKNQDKYTEEDKDKLLYGLEGIYLTITKTIVIFTISYLMGFIKEFFISMILFNIIRYPAFGFHADNSKSCLILSSIVFLGTSYLLLHIQLPHLLTYILYAISFITFLFCAPADTPKRPLKNKKKRFYRKIASMIMVTIYGICIFFCQEKIASYFLFAVILEAFFISPIPYWLYKQPYQNYKR